MNKAVWIALGLVLVALIGGGAYVATHNASSSKAPASQMSQSTTSNNMPKQNTAQSADAAIILVKTDTTLGRYLTDSSSRPLYTYGGDQQGVSNCTGQCLANWPAYVATTTNNLPANVSVITRSDNGIKQYAYKGLALYTFVGDTTGQPTGDSIDNFHLAKP